MNDTQWPRWEVFKKDSPKKPYQAVGSVHAADPEHALLNARNVFVRRPQAVGLWVVPAEAVFSRTAAELKEGLDLPATSDTDPQTVYEIFCKTSHRRSMTFVDHVGQVEATSPEQALKKAIARFTDQEALAWWVVAADLVVRTSEAPEIVAAWFDPAKTKDYKNQSAYGFVSARRPGRDTAGAADDE